MISITSVVEPDIVENPLNPYLKSVMSERLYDVTIKDGACSHLSIDKNEDNTYYVIAEAETGEVLVFPRFKIDNITGVALFEENLGYVYSVLKKE